MANGDEELEACTVDKTGFIRKTDGKTMHVFADDMSRLVCSSCSAPYSINYLTKHWKKCGFEHVRDAPVGGMQQLPRMTTSNFNLGQPTISRVVDLKGNMATANGKCLIHAHSNSRIWCAKCGQLFSLTYFVKHYRQHDSKSPAKARGQNHEQQDSWQAQRQPANEEGVPRCTGRSEVFERLVRKCKRKRMLAAASTLHLATSTSFSNEWVKRQC